MANTILDKLGTRISNEIKAIKNQLLTISSGSIPSGIVLPFTGLVAPLGFLLCHGQEVNRTTYANLFSVLGISHGQGDNVSTFNLPDYRGVFLRGASLASGIDKDAANRQAYKTGGNSGDTIGSYQSDSIQDHAHKFKFFGSVLTNSIDIRNDGAPGNGGLLIGGNNGVGTDNELKIINSTTLPGGSILRSSHETRPVNISVNYIIKF